MIITLKLHYLNKDYCNWSIDKIIELIKKQLDNDYDDIAIIRLKVTLLEMLALIDHSLDNSIIITIIPEKEKILLKAVYKSFDTFELDKDGINLKKSLKYGDIIDCSCVKYTKDTYEISILATIYLSKNALLKHFKKEFGERLSSLI